MTIVTQTAHDGEQLAALARQCKRSVLRCDAATGDVAVLCAGEAAYGCALAPDGRPQTALETGLVAPESAQAYAAFYAAIKSGEPAGSCDARLLRDDGQFRWYHADFTLLRDAAGAPEGALISSCDNTAQLERELAYQQWQKAVASMMAQSYLYVELNVSTGKLEQTQGLENIGLDAGKAADYASLIDAGVGRRVCEGDRARVREFLDRERLVRLFMSGVSADALEYRALADERVVWFRVSAQMAKYPHTGDVKGILVFENIDGLRGEMERLAQAASRDALTGLLNRSAAEKQVGDALRGGGDDLVALYIIDLDNFKLVNDRLGHQQGDRTLAYAADVIRDTFRTSDVVARLGGDEFIVFLPGGATPGVVEKKAAALCGALRFSAGGSVRLSVSVGVCILRRAQASFDELYKRADKALYDAKRNGKSGYRIAADGTPPLAV